MKYVVATIVLVVFFYLLSFAWYNWQNKNKLAAAGTGLLAITVCGLWYIVLFLGNFEL